MIKKAQAKSSSGERQWRSARASLRMHNDLRDAVDFLAKSDRRTVSQLLEMLVIDRVRQLLTNEFTDDGCLVKPGEFRLKDSEKRLA
jgi:hypothetical protein